MLEADLRQIRQFPATQFFIFFDVLNVGKTAIDL